MGMPQSFYIAVISSSGELAAVVAAALSHPMDSVSPCFVAVGPPPINRRLFQDGYSIGFQINEPLGIGWINPKWVDLWLAFDDNAATMAKGVIKERGPAPKNFYRTIFSDPVLRSSIAVPNPPSFGNITSGWISTIYSEIGPLKRILLKAFYESQ